MVTIVLYHHISDESDPLVDNLTLTTPTELFAEHLAYFSKNYDFISEDDLLNSRLPKKPLLITFDDAYRSVLDVAANILRQHSAPSIFFINSIATKNVYLPLDNLLSFAVNEIGIREVCNQLSVDVLYDQPSVGYLFQVLLPKLDSRQRDSLKIKLLKMLGETEEALAIKSKLFLNSDDIRKLEKHRISVGNHSASHTYFRALSEKELTTEICESREMLQTMSGKPVNTLSVPYGNEKDLLPKVKMISQKAGHKAIFLVHSRSNVLRPDPSIYYRTSLRNQSSSHLPKLIRYFPLIRTIRDAPKIFWSRNV